MWTESLGGNCVAVGDAAGGDGVDPTESPDGWVMKNFDQIKLPESTFLL